MPPLTPEEQDRLREKMTWLRDLYVGECAYPYKQGELLKKTSKYKKSGGVCMAMSLDWLRRKLWNVYNASAKAKRNFDDQKYATEKSRIALTTKHGKLQDAYTAGKTRGSESVESVLGKLTTAGVVSSGMDRLTAVQLLYNGRVHGYTFDEALYQRTKDGLFPASGSPNAHYAFKEKLRDALAEARTKLSDATPAVGLMFEISGDEGTGHAMAFFLTRTRDAFFDPNVGEYGFAVATQRTRELNFVANLWFDVYHTFLKMDDLTFSLVTYRAPDVI
jgi:hypothetical protein